MRKRLSANLEIWGVIDFILAVFFILAFITENHKDDDKTVNSYLIISIILFVISYFQIMADDIEFDNEFLYKISKKNETKIPLSKIHTVKLTMTEFNKRNLWKLKYYNESGELKSFRFLPKLFEKNFKEFKEFVKLKNPNCRIINWSSSFDLDQ